jgi:hypothetical protein
MQKIILGVIAKLRNASLCQSVISSACNNSVSTGRIFKKFCVISVEVIEFSLESDKKNGFFACRLIHIFDHISLISY